MSTVREAHDLMPKLLRCQNRSCAKVIQPRSSAVVKTFTVGRIPYHTYYCSQACADIVAKRGTPR
jgi:hypothetical protein